MFYQGVPFEKSTIKSYTPDENLSDATLRGRHLVAEVEDKGVRISSPKDEVLVPWNNVGSISYYPSVVEAKATKAK